MVGSPRVPVPWNSPLSKTAYGKRNSQQGLQSAGVGAHQCGVKAPWTRGSETPFVEGHGNFELRGRTAATRAATSNRKYVRRIFHVAFDLIPEELIVTRVGTFSYGQ